MTDQFIWSFPDLNKHQFTAFGNLLALRSGGQVELASLPEDILDGNESDNGSETSSIDTDCPGRISNPGHGGLMKKFLNCLAEFAANRKGGKSVASTAMREAEESVIIWISRNEGFQSVEKFLFEEKLAGLLSNISCRKETENQSSANSLWDLMLEYQQDRLENNYIPNLRSSFKGCNGLFEIKVNGNFHPALSEVSDLRKLTFDMNDLGEGLLHRHSKLVGKAFEIRMMNTVQELLQTSIHATPKSIKLWECICFLGRLKVAFEKFKQIADELPSFCKVIIHLVPYDVTAVQSSLSGAITLKEVFDLLKVPFNESNAKIVVGQKWSLKKVQQEFAKRQKQKFNVHAEVQMLLFFSRRDEGFRELFPYFGCSKYSCFMCFHFLQAHGRIKTRGCHGRIFKPWIVPEGFGLAPGQGAKLAKALIQVQKCLKKELKSEVPKVMRHIKTSVIGGSSIFIENDAVDVRRKKDLEKMRLKSEQDRVADRFRRLALEETASISRSPGFEKWGHNYQVMIEDGDYLDECYVCTRMTSRKCSICNRDAYCSESCEEKRSSSHIFTCRKRPLTTADYLYRSIADDKLPDDEDVREDFGFNHLTSYIDQSKLLGVYKGLWLSDNVTVEEVHKWQVEGSLVTNIKEYFYNMPEDCRGGYFPWFLNNTHILDQSMTTKEAKENMTSTFFDKSRSYLDIEDRQKDLEDLEPEAKRQAYIFLVASLHAASPNPIELNWNNFGFCTCNCEEEEGELGGLYQKLLHGYEQFFSDLPGRYWLQHLKRVETASFTEFWHAFESGSLIQLMDAKGLKNDRLRFPYLETYLSVPPSGPQPSVWSLKQFLAVNSPAEFPPRRATNFDYGFSNCQTFEEICILMEIYKRLLTKANPLDLHEACLAGQLFEFADKFDQMDEVHRRLMRNCYPLNNLVLSGVFDGSVCHV